MFDRLPLPSQFDRTIVAGGTVAGLAGGPILVVLLGLMIAGTISVAEMVFYLAAAVVLAGALGAVLIKNIVHASLALIATLLGVAGIYLLLLTEFLALVQILVYGGGVIILLLFALMMTNAQDDPIVQDGTQKPFAFGVAALIGGVFIAALLDAQWGSPTAAVVPFRDFGMRLFRDFSVPVIIVAILLDIAFTGAFVNARRAEAEDGEGRS
ncbi:MAG: NADH-quinone oxidoreductase subunit J [Chloroflexi bacterium]|nr:NADH-quinone oxidoreductase subunit J [Chloroflexota bacterium]MDA1240020.1 NADH-quinone oxidoreductase subunit J [Chloroflexota bacterium]MQC18958.1 NADH-quinone oxidoreductase subunit J [Chloroflexota bacterium]MQC48367.1 NADH-quinone oxidoreductase subunit J [Chloroflexota bacterium]